MYSPREVVASAARTTSGDSGALVVGGGGALSADTISLLVRVTAASGTTPSLALSVEWSMDGTNYAVVDGTADTFAAITTTAARVKMFETKALYYRVVWAITGTTPSFTFTVHEWANTD